MKKIIALLLFLITVSALFCVSSFGYDWSEYTSDANYFVTYLTDNTCRIDEIDFKKSEVTIPSQIHGKTVTELGDGTNNICCTNNGCTKLILPNTIQKINDNVNKDVTTGICQSLIITGNNIQYIGEKALYKNRDGLKDIVFQDLSFDNAKKLEFAKDSINSNSTKLYFPDDYAYDIRDNNSSLKNNFDYGLIIYPKTYYSGSTISEGNVWIIAGIAVVAIVAVAVVVAKKKKKIAE